MGALGAAGLQAGAVMALSECTGRNWDANRVEQVECGQYYEGPKGIICCDKGSSKGIGSMLAPSSSQPLHLRGPGWGAVKMHGAVGRVVRCSTKAGQRAWVPCTLHSSHALVATPAGTPTLRAVIKHKWRMYARTKLFTRAVNYCFYTLVFTAYAIMFSHVRLGYIEGGGA